LIIASTAASAAVRVLKRPVTKSFDITLLLPFSHQLQSISIKQGETLTLSTKLIEQQLLSVFGG
jgi:hypothetical protein